MWNSNKYPHIIIIIIIIIMYITKKLINTNENLDENY
jgi:hypothetical protein